MSEDCILCNGAGYLLDQTYGYADVPEGWVPVQACDACEHGRELSDEEAAMCAANDRDDIDHRVHYAFFPGGWADDGDAGPDIEQQPGDWAIGPNQ